PSGIVGKAYGPFTFSASGGTPPYTFTVFNGKLPDGLSLDSSSGVLSGTPLASAAGFASFTVQAKDSAGQTKVSDLLQPYISAALAASSTTLPDGTVGQPYGPVTLSAS